MSQISSLVLLIYLETKFVYCRVSFDLIFLVPSSSLHPRNMIPHNLVEACFKQVGLNHYPDYLVYDSGQSWVLFLLFCCSIKQFTKRLRA